MPLVSVIIPTRDRPQLLVRAVRSVLEQSLGDLEVVVVLDGPQPESACMIEALGSDRVRVIEQAAGSGANRCRNRGVNEARSAWTAFLDDDDVWLPQKLERQLEGAIRSPFKRPIIGCQAISRSPRADILMPRRAPTRGECVSRYLFRRTQLVHGEGLVQCSTLLAPRSLCLEVPWPEHCNSFHEAFWLLSATEAWGSGLHVVMEPLVLWMQDEDRERLTSNPVSWRKDLQTALDLRHRFTPEAYASFLLTSMADALTRSSNRYLDRVDLACEAAVNGEPSLLDWVIFIQVSTLPVSLRRRVRDAAVRLFGLGGRKDDYPLQSVSSQDAS